MTAGGVFSDMGLNRVLMGVNPCYSALPLASTYAACLGSLRCRRACVLARGMSGRRACWHVGWRAGRRTGMRAGRRAGGCACVLARASGQRAILLVLVLVLALVLLLLLLKTEYMFLPLAVSPQLCSRESTPDWAMRWRCRLHLLYLRRSATTPWV